MTYPLLQVGDLKAVVTFAKANGLKSIIDNTFTSPINFRPLDYGFDLSLHSASKYLNGHSDVVAGAAIGSKELIHNINEKLCYLGGCLDPHALFLLQRGIKTLALRVRYQALKIAQFLEQHPAVVKVNYPGLVSSPLRSVNN
ncbi:MAG TPA: PLP-dependent transferase [Gammaproteobacteria bacterium]|nr:PLP-dependent transferase [Gammaproteobacteria bacterium]